MNLAGWIVGIALIGTDGRVDFDRDVRPILAANCLDCHGPKKQKGGLALHLKAEALAIEGGDDGRVIRRRARPSPRAGSSAMSPGSMRITRCPRRGRANRSRPIRSASFEAGSTRARAWPDEPKPGDSAEPSRSLVVPAPDPARGRPSVKRPILAQEPDRSVRPWRRLERDGHASLRARPTSATLDPPPGPRPDRPPPLDQRRSTAFEFDDKSPDAYERQVDRLLATPHYGERWARRWLDGARYADTNGYEKDRERSIWPYRDWVIQVPERGHALRPLHRRADRRRPPPGLDNRGPEGGDGVPPEHDDLTRKAGSTSRSSASPPSSTGSPPPGAVWLGLTIQCAQCHTHKYDPITQPRLLPLPCLLQQRRRARPRPRRPRRSPRNGGSRSGRKIAEPGSVPWLGAVPARRTSRRSTGPPSSPSKAPARSGPAPRSRPCRGPAPILVVRTVRIPEADKSTRSRFEGDLSRRGRRSGSKPCPRPRSPEIGPRAGRANGNFVVLNEFDRGGRAYRPGSAHEPSASPRARPTFLAGRLRSRRGARRQA